MTRQEFDELTKDKTYDDIIYDLVNSVDNIKGLTESCLTGLYDRVVKLENYAKELNNYFTQVVNDRTNNT